MTLENQLCNLWAKATLKQRRIKSSRSILKRLEKTASKINFALFFKNGGTISMRRNEQGSLVAAVLITEVDKEKQFTQNILIITLPGDRHSLKWVQNVLKRQLPALGKRCKGRIEPWQTDLLPLFYKHKIQVRSIRLEGDVEASLKRLRKHYGRKLREPFESAGLELAPARTPEEIEAYIHILRSEYSKNPHFGIGVASTEFLNFIRQDMLQALRRREKSLWLVHQKGKLIGGVDIIDLGKGIDGRPRAGFGVNLIGKAQGQGFSRAIYESILLELQSRGIRTYTGSTAQPGVMRLGVIMGRRLKGIEVDRGIAASFPKQHFETWLEGAQQGSLN